VRFVLVASSMLPFAIAWVTRGGGVSPRVAHRVAMSWMVAWVRSAQRRTAHRAWLWSVWVRWMVWDVEGAVGHATSPARTLTCGVPFRAFPSTSGRSGVRWGGAGGGQGW
jgi:hypothetical protein